MKKLKKSVHRMFSKKKIEKLELESRIFGKEMIIAVNSQFTIGKTVFFSDFFIGTSKIAKRLTVSLVLLKQLCRSNPFVKIPILC